MSDFDYEAEERAEVQAHVVQTADALAEAVEYLREIACDSDVDTGEMSLSARDVLVNLLQILNEREDIALLVEDAML